MTTQTWSDDYGPALWRITGHEDTPAGGGQVQFYAVTEDGSTLPDPRAAHRVTQGDKATLLWVDQIDRLDFDRVSEFVPGGEPIADQRPRGAFTWAVAGRGKTRSTARLFKADLD